MKIFRKLSALILVAVMVCMFSVSAFAATSFSDLKTYDDGETYVDVYASINSTSSSGTLSLTAVGLQWNRLDVDAVYAYDTSSGFVSGKRVLATETVWSSCTASTNGLGVTSMESATYIFSVDFSSWSGENSYASTSGTLEP